MIRTAVAGFAVSVATVAAAVLYAASLPQEDLDSLIAGLLIREGRA